MRLARISSCVTGKIPQPNTEGTCAGSRSVKSGCELMNLPGQPGKSYEHEGKPISRLTLRVDNHNNLPP